MTRATRTTAPAARRARKAGQNGKVAQANAFEEEVQTWLLRDKLLNDLFGGPVPLGLDLARVESVLDLDSNAGGWLCDLARLDPKMSCFGVEPCIELVREARRLGEEMELENVTFIQQEIEYVKGCRWPLFCISQDWLSSGIFRGNGKPIKVVLCRAGLPCAFLLVSRHGVGSAYRAVGVDRPVPVDRCCAIGRL
jgi:hypothetical protein